MSVTGLCSTPSLDMYGPLQGLPPLPHTRPPSTPPWLPCLSFIVFTNQSNTPMYLQVSPAFGILLQPLNPEKMKTSHPRRPEPWLSAFFLPTHSRTTVDHNISATFNRNWISFVKCITSRSVNVLQHDGHLKLALLVASRSSVSILFLIRSNLYFTTLTNVWKM